MQKIKASTIDEYIAAAPEYAKEKLQELRKILKEVAPKAKEAIKWGYPILEEERILFSFSAFKSHINFMPTGPALKPFEKELKGYERGKDTIKFTYDKPLPKELIRKIAEYRLKDVRLNDAKWMY